MISKEEFDLLQNKMEQIKEERNSYKIKIEELEEQNKKIPELQEKVAELEKQNEKEEAKQMQELKEATINLNAARSELSNEKEQHENKNIKRLEAQLASLKEKNDKLDQELQDLNNDNEKNSAVETPLDEQLAEFKKHVDLIKEKQEDMPAISNILLQVNDLESRREQITKCVEALEKQIEDLNAADTEAENNKSHKMSELRKVQAEIDSANEQVKSNESQHIDCYKELNKVSVKLQELNNLSRKEKAKLDELTESYTAKKAAALKESNEIEAQIREVEQQLEGIPAKRKQMISELEEKKEAMQKTLEELEKKKEDVKNEIQEKLDESKVVADLTKTMEIEWLKHQRLVDERDKMIATIERAEEDIRRKKLASEEIEKKWPKSGKPFKEPGMQELDYMYNQARAQNRALGESLASLKDDLEIIRKDNELLRSFAESENCE